MEDSFISHLIELRSRVVKAALSVLIIFGILYFGWPGGAAIYDFMARPMSAALPHGTTMIATGIISPFLIPMKLTFLVSFVIALPWVLYQVWAFIAPGLYAHEKRLIAPLVISSTLLFAVGVAFCYFFVFGNVFKVIYEYAPKAITISPDIESYFDFVMTMCLAFGIIFEVPIVVIVLVRMGLVSVEKLKQIRSYVIVAAFAIAAVVAPPDVMSMIFMAVPICILYEVGLLVAPLFIRATQAPEEAA